MARRGERSAEDRLDDRAVYVISVAAELAGVHPQTLRIYERKGLLHPARTAGNTRRYSDRDIARLRMIQALTQESGLNLAGVKMIVEMENELDRMRRRTEELSRELRRAREHLRDQVQALQRARERMRQEMEDVRRRYRAEIVPASSARSAFGIRSPGSRESAGGVRVGPIPVGPSSASPGGSEAWTRTS
ncbi:hypothetical protein BH20ACT24_BH20ACT24_24210 [soil metagenome]